MKTKCIIENCKRKVWQDEYCYHHHPMTIKKKELLAKIREEAKIKEDLERLHQSW